jgi:hypothetical protein
MKIAVVFILLASIHALPTDEDSLDLMDTAKDMAESIADVPAKDIKSKDGTTKVLGETVFKSGVEDMEELEAEVSRDVSS